MDFSLPFFFELSGEWGGASEITNDSNKVSMRLLSNQHISTREKTIYLARIIKGPIRLSVLAHKCDAYNVEDTV